MRLTETSCRAVRYTAKPMETGGKFSYSRQMLLDDATRGLVLRGYPSGEKSWVVGGAPCLIGELMMGQFLASRRGPESDNDSTTPARGKPSL